MFTLSLEVTGEVAGVGHAPLVRPGEPGLLGLFECSGEFNGLVNELDFRDILIGELVLLIILGGVSFKSFSSLAASKHIKTHVENSKANGWT